MRTIKFRAWDKKRKIMGWNFWLDSQDNSIQIFDEEKDTPLPPDDFEVMQFTGLTDRNGKEIYEGDIVRCFMNGEEHSLNVIKWADYGYTMTDFEDESGERVLWFCEVEVIGNIWKNPDLINKK